MKRTLQEVLKDTLYPIIALKAKKYSVKTSMTREVLEDTVVSIPDYIMRQSTVGGKDAKVPSTDPH
jgi:hypothetical protein